LIIALKYFLLIKFASDSSFGWNGYNEGFTVYYPHFTEFIPAQHRSFGLSARLTPIVEFQNIQRSLLGTEFIKITFFDTCYFDVKVYFSKVWLKLASKRILWENINPITTLNSLYKTYQDKFVWEGVFF
jgi:hypothetical protein